MNNVFFFYRKSLEITKSFIGCGNIIHDKRDIGTSIAGACLPLQRHTALT